MAHIMIIGGHGKVAQLATPLLIEAGHTVTSVIRNPDHADAIVALGATPRVVDVEASTTQDFVDLFDGVDAVVWSAGAGGGNPARTYAVDRDAAIATIDAAAQANVSRYVMVSYHGASTDHGVPADHSFFPYAEAKGAADAHLMDAKVPWTILGPGALTLAEPSGQIRRVGRGVADQLPDGASRDTSRANVARTIVAALASKATVNTVVDFVDGQTPITEVFS